MGDPKKPRKKYSAPSHPWIKERIEEEAKLVARYGLKNKREVWRTKSLLGRYRRQARLLLARLRSEEKQAIKEEEQLLKRLHRYGLVKENANLDDVLALNVEDFLARRLQTLVYMRGLANTIRQARQFIVHGHIAINGRKITIPGYLVKKDEEDSIEYFYKSPIKDEDHPVRPSLLKSMKGAIPGTGTQVERQIKIEDIGKGDGESPERSEVTRESKEA